MTIRQEEVPSAPRRVERRTSREGFRPDIEGLRAIAVIAVVLFHAGIPGIAGGFVGVDVFFVISGFLITGLLLARGQHHQYRSRSAASTVRGPAACCRPRPPSASSPRSWPPSSFRRCRRGASSSTASPARCMSAITGSPCRAPTTWPPTCRLAVPALLVAGRRGAVLSGVAGADHRHGVAAPAGARRTRAQRRG